MSTEPVPIEFPILFLVMYNGFSALHVENFSTREGADTAFALAHMYGEAVDKGPFEGVRVAKLYKEPNS